jgi:hypothetical protein
MRLDLVKVVKGDAFSVLGTVIPSPFLSKLKLGERAEIPDAQAPI